MPARLLRARYRPLIRRPEQLCCREVRHHGARDELQRGECAAGAPPFPLAGELSWEQAAGELPPCGDGALSSTQLAFTLPPSTYATMLLREVAEVRKWFEAAPAR